MTQKSSLLKTLSIVIGVAIASIALFAISVQAATTPSIMPTSDGAFTAWTPSTGATHYTLVDETTCNGTTDYNKTTVLGNRDSYGVSLSSVPNGATITAISLTPCASNDSTGGSGSTLKLFYRYNGTSSADSAGITLPTGKTPTQLSATTFSGLSLVKTSTSTLEAGAVLTAGAKGARLSRLATVVTFSPLAPVVTTLANSSSTATTTRLNGTAIPNGATTTAFFRYSTVDPVTCNDSFGTRAPAFGGTNLGSGVSAVPFSQLITGLSASTTYYYCALAGNTVATTTGNVLTFSI